MTTPYDAPDWSNRVASSARYLGTVTGAGPGNGSASFTLAPDDRSLVIIPSGAAGMGIDVTVKSHTLGLATGQLVWGEYTALGSTLPGQVAVLPSVDLTWDVDWTLTGSAGTFTGYVFATSELPVAYNASGPLPVVLSDGQGYLLGPQAAAQSLPVVQAPNYAGLVPNILAMQNPAVGVRALVSIPAVAGQRCTLAWVSLSVTQTAAAAGNVDAFVTDAAGGGGNVWLETNLAVDGVAGHRASLDLSGLSIQSAVGQGMSVGFLAGLPGVIQRVSAGIVQA